MVVLRTISIVLLKLALRHRKHIQMLIIQFNLQLHSHKLTNQVYRNTSNNQVFNKRYK